MTNVTAGRLPLQLQPDAIPAQLPALRVEFEGAESVGLRLADGHSTPPRKIEKYAPEHWGRSVILVPLARPPWRLTGGPEVIRFEWEPRLMSAE